MVGKIVAKTCFDRRGRISADRTLSTRRITRTTAPGKLAFGGDRVPDPCVSAERLYRFTFEPNEGGRSTSRSVGMLAGGVEQ